MAQRRTLQPLPLTSASLRQPAGGSGHLFALSGSSVRQLEWGGFGGLPRRYLRGELVISQGAVRPGLLVVREGLLREGAVSASGHWLVHDLLGPGAVAGSIAGARPARASVRAVGPSTVETISPELFCELLRRCPDAAWSLVARIERRARRSEVLARQLAWYDVPDRLRFRLRSLAVDHGRRVPEGVRIEVPLTQEDLAAMVAAARETVNRALVGLVAGGELRIERRRYVLRGELLRGSFDDDAEW